MPQCPAGTPGAGNGSGDRPAGRMGLVASLGRRNIFKGDKIWEPAHRSRPGRVSVSHPDEAVMENHGPPFVLFRRFMKPLFLTMLRSLRILPALLLTALPLRAQQVIHGRVADAITL